MCVSKCIVSECMYVCMRIYMCVCVYLHPPGADVVEAERPVVLGLRASKCMCV